MVFCFQLWLLQLWGNVVVMYLGLIYSFCSEWVEINKTNLLNQIRLGRTTLIFVTGPVILLDSVTCRKGFVILSHIFVGRVLSSEQLQPFCIGSVLRILALNTELQSYYVLELGFWVALLTLCITLVLFRW